MSDANGGAPRSAGLNVSAGLTGKGAPLAVRGYDIVAYFDPGEPVLGVPEHSIEHDGATYRFASALNLRRFQTDPDAFLPAFGGFCAYGVSIGAKFDGDPLVWAVVEGQLYLNLNSEIQSAWEADLMGAIEAAEGHWPQIQAVDPSELTPQT